jgi:hypothetical protein
VEEKSKSNFAVFYRRFVAAATTKLYTRREKLREVEVEEGNESEVFQVFEKIKTQRIDTKEGDVRARSQPKV